MKNRRFRTMLSAMITIILSISIISGSTFAIFTSNDKVDIAVTGGKVQVTANVNKDTLKVFSKDVEQTLTDNNGAKLFENGGTASFDTQDKLVLDRVTPGDKVTFDIDVVNGSNVDVIYRVNWAVSGELLNSLIAKADDQTIVNNTTDWTEWDITEGYEKTIAMCIELPIDVNDDYQEKTATVSYSIEFVQANADLPDEWDGTADTTWYTDNPDATEYSISTAEQLAGLADLVKGGIVDAPITTYNTTTTPEKLGAVSFDGVTFTLTGDIDLYQLDENGERVSFRPIGYGYDNPFKGTFDGGNHTIKNLYQNGWELGLSYSTEGGGLFASVVDTTIKNLTIDNAEIVMECIDMGVLVGYSYGTCNYENITIKNSQIANYNRYTGGVVGEINGYQNFKNVDVIDTTISALWGTYDCVCGGIIGGKWGEAEVTLEDCDVKVILDVFNDACSNYQYYNYRLSGMLIGNTEETTDGVASASYLTAINCSVTYSDWMNYTYCEFEKNGAGSYNGPGEWKFSRVQAGYAYDGIDMNHTHDTDESHEELLIFEQIFGGDKGVRGGKTHVGITVNYPASYNPENN